MATQEKKEILPQKEAEVPAIEIVQPAIEKLIYVIRDKQVIPRWFYFSKAKADLINSAQVCFINLEPS